MSVRPSVGPSVISYFFWLAGSELCRVCDLVCPSLVCHSVGCARWLPYWFCVIFIVLLSYYLSFALVCTTVHTTTVLILIFWLWWFDDLMSFRAIVPCHVFCIVCHAIRSMSLIFGRIYMHVLVDCTAFRRLKTQVLLACERLLAFCFPPGIVGRLASAHGCSVLVLLSTGYCFCVYLILTRFTNMVECT